MCYVERLKAGKLLQNEAVETRREISSGGKSYLRLHCPDVKLADESSPISIESLAASLPLSPRISFSLLPTIVVDLNTKLFGITD